MTPGKGSKYREFYDLSGRITCMLVYADSIDLFSDAFGPRGAKPRTDEHFRKIQQIQPSPDTIMEFFIYDFYIVLILDRVPTAF